MAKKVLSIEVGNSLTKIMEVDYRVKNPKVYHCVSLVTPEGIVNDGAVRVTQEFAEAIKKSLAAGKIKTKQTVFSITSSKIANREVTVPKVKDNRIKTLIETNASDYFPVQMSDYELGYSIMAEQEGEGGQMRLLVYAAPKKILQDYQKLAAACGLSVVGYDYGGNGLYQVIKAECSAGNQMVVKVDESTTLVTILQDGIQVLQRNINYGVDAIIQECMESNEMEYPEALKTLRRSDYISDEEEGTESEESIGYLVSGVLRVMDYYNSRNNGIKIDKILLTGLGGDIAGLAERMTDDLGFQVDVLKKAEGFNIERHFRDTSFGEYISCLGAAVAPLGFITEEKEASKKKGSAFDGIAVILFVGGIFISLALVVASLMPYLIAKKENSDKKLYLTSLRYMEEIYNTYTAEKAENDYLHAINTATMNRNEEIGAFIRELEQKMPSDIRVTSLVCDEQSVLMSVEVSSKNEAANVVDTLMGFNSLAWVDVTSVSEGKNGDEEDTTVSFTVSCVYYPYGVTEVPGQTEEVEEDEAE